MEELDVMIADAMKKIKISLLNGRPRRDLPINSDDIVNLRIALQTETSLEEFLKHV
jgi:hypothetical protein